MTLKFVVVYGFSHAFLPWPFDGQGKNLSGLYLGKYTKLQKQAGGFTLLFIFTGNDKGNYQIGSMCMIISTDSLLMQKQVFLTKRLK